MAFPADTFVHCWYKLCLCCGRTQGLLALFPGSSPLPSACLLAMGCIACSMVPPGRSALLLLLLPVHATQNCHWECCPISLRPFSVNHHCSRASVESGMEDPCGPSQWMEAQWGMHSGDFPASGWRLTGACIPGTCQAYSASTLGADVSSGGVLSCPRVHLGLE